MLPYSIYFSSVTITALSILAPTLASASMPEAQYLAQLKIANQKVERQKHAQVRQPGSNSGLNPGLHEDALSSSVIKQLFGRYYQKGDSWDIAAWQFEHQMMRKSDATSTPEVGRGGIFHYEVTQVINGPNPEVTLQITQLTAPLLPAVDPKVHRLQLKMTDQIKQTEKTYFFNGDPQNMGRVASPNGIHTSLSAMELYPLDVPEISMTEQEHPTALPKLPARVLNAKWIQSSKYNLSLNPDLANTLSFHSDDFFGRPIEIWWALGSPWPFYIQTSGGIAILLNQKSATADRGHL